MLFWSTLLALPFWTYFLAAKRKEAKRLTAKDYMLLGSMALVSSVGVKIVEVFALRYGSAITFTFFIRTNVLFTALFAYFLLGERLTKKKLFLILILLFGAYLLATNGALSGLKMPDLLGILAAVLIALGNNVFGKMATNRMSPELAAGASMFLGAIPLLVFSSHAATVTAPKSLFLIIALAILSFALTKFKFNAYHLTSASYVAMMFALTPAFVSFMAIALLGESMTPIQVFGGGAVIAAGIFIEKLNQSERSARPH